MAMKLMIIQPTYYQNPSARSLYKTRKRWLVGLTLPYLAALTPPDWAVELIDEQVMEIDFAAPVDLVAITTWTINSFRAYEIAHQFRQRGIPVIMGGPHTFFHAEEALDHCDAVGIGEGEEIWPVMLHDAANGRLQRLYRAPRSHHLKGLPIPRYDLLKLQKYGYGRFRTYAVQASRGCPFKCEFCSERFYIGERYRYRPTEEIVEEIKQIQAKYVFFADSMFAGKKEHAMELMEALIPLKIRWSTLWTTYLCLDQPFMDLAQRSGLLHVNMGMESISQETLAAMNKPFNKVDQYEAILASLRRRGISFSLNFVFGFDGEQPEVFASTLAFLERYKVPVAYFYILSPHKGTPLYDRLKREHRILDAHQMRRWPRNHCEIKPLYCSPQELEAQVQHLYDAFYSLPSIVRRLPLPVTQSHMVSWVLNVSQRRMRRSERTLQNFDWA